MRRHILDTAGFDEIELTLPWADPRPLFGGLDDFLTHYDGCERFSHRGQCRSQRPTGSKQDDVGLPLLVRLGSADSALQRRMHVTCFILVSTTSLARLITVDLDTEME